ncbi:MAG TPA: hypothetical protein VFF06_27415, partial [Polyangia bacterium]|nr:hypothetical protein [Polyangia bacterium]
MPTTSWQTLVRCWETLRKLNVGGFRMGTNEWLIGIDWGAGWADHQTHPGERNVTACSPCAVQAVVMAFASAEQRA